MLVVRAVLYRPPLFMLSGGKPVVLELGGVPDMEWTRVLD